MGSASLLDEIIAARTATDPDYQPPAPATREHIVALVERLVAATTPEQIRTLARIWPPQQP